MNQIDSMNRPHSAALCARLLGRNRIEDRAKGSVKGSLRPLALRLREFIPHALGIPNDFSSYSLYPRLRCFWSPRSARGERAFRFRFQYSATHGRILFGNGHDVKDKYHKNRQIPEEQANDARPEPNRNAFVLGNQPEIRGA